MQAERKDFYKLTVLGILSRHVGREKAIGMGELYEETFGEPWHHRINDTRELRRIITELRDDGTPICSVSSPSSPGYYLAAAGSEERNYIDRLKGQAIRKLTRAAKIEKISLPELLGQMSLNLKTKAKA